jgi:hypothetical protein
MAVRWHEPCLGPHEIPPPRGERYDATHTNDEVPGWVTVDTADSVYVAGMGGPSSTTGNVSFLKQVTQKYDAAGNPVWTILDGGNAQVTVDDGSSPYSNLASARAR